MLQKRRRRPAPRVFVVVCMREATALPELVHHGAPEPLARHKTFMIGRHGPCVPYALENPCAQATEKLKRFVCDRHNRPIVTVAEGSLPRDGGQAS